MAQNKFKEIIFDLDGTVVYSHPGICNAVSYALLKKGIIEENTDKLKRFVGPPLYESFSKYYGFSKEEAVECVEIYREYYREKGVYEFSLIPKMDYLIKRLYENGTKVFLGTGKPEIFAKIIIEKLGLTKYFEAIVGSNLDGSRITKDEVFSYIKDIFCLENPVIVGDTSFDVQGAQKNGIDCVYITYGYPDNLVNFNKKPIFTANSVDELINFVL